MKFRFLPAIALALVLTLAYAGPAWAEANSGISILGTYASDSMDDTTPAHDHSAGVGGGLDFQLALGGMFSINPAIIYTVLPAADLFGTVTNRYIGLEGRIWFGNAFLGLHKGHFKQSRGSLFGGGSDSGSGTTTGYTLGSEQESGFYFAFVWDDSEANFATYDTTVGGYKLMIGKRFK